MFDLVFHVVLDVVFDAVLEAVLNVVSDFSLMLSFKLLLKFWLGEPEGTDRRPPPQSIARLNCWLVLRPLFLVDFSFMVWFGWGGVGWVGRWCAKSYSC